MFAFLGSLAARFGLKMLLGRAAANAKADVARIPPKVKLALLGLALLAGAYFLHQHFAHKALKAQYNAGYAQGQKDAADAQATAQAAADARAEQINSNIRSKSDEKARTITHGADDLRLRGPGKAVCPGPAAPGRAASGREPGPGPADAAVGQVPDGGGAVLVAVPFADLVTFAEEHDLNLNEVKSWRQSDKEQRAESVKLDPSAISRNGKSGGD